MDPSPLFCEIPGNEGIDIKLVYPYELYRCDKEEILTPTKAIHNFDLDVEISLNENKSVNVSELLLTKRKNLHEIIKNNSYLPHAIVKIQPFTNIQHNFKLNGAIKLANIDALFHIIPQTIDILSYYRKDGTPLFFGSIAEGPGGFTEYLQFRFPRSNVIGMTLTEPKNMSWNFNVINRKNFIEVLGSDLTGNIMTSYDDYINYVKTRYTTGIDFICADAVIGSETGLSKLLLIECFICLSCIKLNRSVVIRLEDTFTTFSSHLLFLMSICFKQSYIFKPCTVDTHTNEKYFIGKNSLYQKEEIIPILKQLIIQYENNKYINTIIDENSSKKYNLFKQNLINLNNTFVMNEIMEMEKIINYLDAKIVSLPRYNQNKSPIIWNLP